MKNIIFSISSTPENPAMGYGDKLKIIEDSTVIFESPASTCPNPYKPSANGLNCVPWRFVYAWVDVGTYPYEVVTHKKFGKCILINKGEAVAIRNENRIHNNLKIATEVFIHRGGINSVNKNWRGSRGCLTMHPNQYVEFIDKFTIGETGILHIQQESAS